MKNENKHDCKNQIKENEKHGDKDCVGEINRVDDKSQCDAEVVEDKSDSSKVDKEETVPKSEYEKILAERDLYKKQADENKQSWYRTAADFDNFKKRNAETRLNAYTEGKGDVVKNILHIGDNLERALNSAQDDKTKDGMALVIRSFSETLKNLGVEEIDPVGKPFDPNFHEAVMQAECGENEQPGTVKTVFRKGYSMNGKMLRYAQVSVVKEK